MVNTTDMLQVGKSEAFLGAACVSCSLSFLQAIFWLWQETLIEIFVSLVLCSDDEARRLTQNCRTKRESLEKLRKEMASSEQRISNLQQQIDENVKELNVIFMDLFVADNCTIFQLLACQGLPVLLVVCIGKQCVHLLWFCCLLVYSPDYGG